MSDDARHSRVRTSACSTPKLDAALAKVQGEIEPAPKGSKSQHYGSYADLASIIEACRSPCSKHGVARYQSAWSDDHGVVVTTRLAHDGEWIEADLHMPVEKRNAHGVGSAITYAKRYGLAALLGVATADDDGGKANDNPPKKTTSARPKQKKPNRKEPGEPMCTGKLQPVADALRARRVEFANLASSSVDEVWLEVCKRVQAPAINGGAPEPEQLTKTLGLAAKELLDKWIMSKRADAPPPGGEADQRQPGDDDDHDPTAQDAP